MSGNGRVLVLAIDGGSRDLLRRWAGDGTMPNLARLIAAGASGTTRGLKHFFIGSTWPSLYTGKSPAEHGHHSLVQLRPGTYDYYWMRDGDLVKRPPFWDILSRAGRRVAILDVPLSKLSPNLNGIQTVEWGSHDAVYGFQCSNRELEREILSKFGVHPLGPTCDGSKRTPMDYEKLIRRLISGVERKTELTLELLCKERWDFFMQVYTESHCVGHQCWHLHDESHPAHDSSFTAVTGDPLQRVYSAIDSGIGQITDSVGDDVSVVVFSAHGMSYWYGAQFMLPEILYRLGVTMPLQEIAERRRAIDPIIDVGTWGWHRLPMNFRRRLGPLRERLWAAANRGDDAPILGVDAAQSCCFPVHNGLMEGGIRLNLVGREPNGRIKPGPEADTFCAELRRELLAIIDERTGDRLVRDVVRTRDVMSGSNLNDLPDLLVQWSDDVPTGSTNVGDGQSSSLRAHSRRIGTVEAANAYGRTGEHRADGFCVIAGPNIQSGTLREDFSLLDYAQTFIEMMGVERPSS